MFVLLSARWSLCWTRWRLTTCAVWSPVWTSTSGVARSSAPSRRSPRARRMARRQPRTISPTTWRSSSSRATTTCSRPPFTCATTLGQNISRVYGYILHEILSLSKTIKVAGSNPARAIENFFTRKYFISWLAKWVNFSWWYQNFYLMPVDFGGCFYGDRVLIL